MEREEFVCTVCDCTMSMTMWTRNDVCDHCRDFEYDDYGDDDEDLSDTEYE